MHLPPPSRRITDRVHDHPALHVAVARLIVLVKLHVSAGRCNVAAGRGGMIIRCVGARTRTAAAAPSRPECEDENGKRRESFRLFEIGREIRKQRQGLPSEVPHLAAAVFGRKYSAMISVITFSAAVTTVSGKSARALAISHSSGSDRAAEE